MFYSVHGDIDEKETFSFLRNGETVEAKMVIVSIRGPEPGAAGLGGSGESGLVSFSHDGEEYSDEIIADSGGALQMCFAAKGVSVRPQNVGETIGMTITLVGKDV